MRNHQSRVASKVKQTSRLAFVLDWGLNFYLLFGIFYLVSFYAEFTSKSSNFSWAFAVISLAMTFAMSRGEVSLGKIILFTADRFLQQNVNLSKTSLSAIFARSYGALLLVITIWIGFIVTDFSIPALFNAEGIAGAQRIFSALVRPELSIIEMVVKALVETVYMALMATLIAIPIAFLASFFCARNLMRVSLFGTVVYRVLRLIFNFTSSVEPLIWAIIFSVWVGIGPFAGMLALTLHSISSLARLYSEQIESIERGTMEAIEATGANRIQVIWYAVVPQIVLPYLSFTIYRWDINIRMATIIGLVGGGGIGTLLMQYQGLARWHEVGTIIFTIAFVVWVMDFLSAKLREAIY